MNIQRAAIISVPHVGPRSGEGGGGGGRLTVPHRTRWSRVALGPQSCQRNVGDARRSFRQPSRLPRNNESPRRRFRSGTGQFRNRLSDLQNRPVGELGTDRKQDGGWRGGVRFANVYPRLPAGLYHLPPPPGPMLSWTNQIAWAVASGCSTANRISIFLEHSGIRVPL